MPTQYTLNQSQYELWLIETDEDADNARMFDHLERADNIVVDIESGGLRFHVDPLAGIALYVPHVKRAYYISVGHEGKRVTERTLNPLRNLLTRGDKFYHFWNAKFDLKFLQYNGFPYLEHCPPICDVMVALHLLDENRYSKGKNYKLKDAAREFIDGSAAGESDALDQLLKQRKLGKGNLDKLTAAEVGQYAMMDVILTWELSEYFIPYLKEWNLLKLYTEQNEFIMKVLTRMEYTGIMVDRELIIEHIREMEDLSNKMLQDLHIKAGNTFNPNSSAQVSKFLKTDNAQKKTLERHGSKDAELVLSYKAAAKAKSTFYEPYLEYSLYDGRIHPTMNVIGTVSGRLSSSDPNLQQVPRKAKKGNGYKVKDVFIAPPGKSLVQLDYAQLELRLACYFAGEKTMTHMFNEGIDLHQYTADELNIDRQTGKNMNFGLLYGMGPNKAADFLNIPLEAAEKLVPRWRKLYPAFMETAQNLYSLAQSWRDRNGNPTAPGKGWKYIRLPDGRVRRYNFPDANEFTAWNTLVQGTGAILTRRALLRIADFFPYPDPDVELTLTVHDSIILTVSDEALDRVVPVVKHLMTDFPEYTPKIEVDVQIGKSWGKLE